MKMSRIIIAEKAKQCHNVTRGVGINCSKLLLNTTDTVQEYVTLRSCGFDSLHFTAAQWCFHTARDWEWNWNQWVLHNRYI